jgi:Apea-like HEPN
MIKLTTSDESNLILTIADVLKEARVSPTGRVSFKDTRSIHRRIHERIGPELDGRIAEVCGEFGVLDFLRHYLSRELLSQVDRLKSGPLTGLPTYSDTLESARRLVEAIESLPRKLRVVSPLPRSLSPMLFHGVENLQLGSGTHVVSSEWLFAHMNLELGSTRLSRNILKTTDLSLLPRNRSHYLCTWHSGFPGGFVGNQSVQDHMDRIRAFNGCLLAADVMEEDFFFESLPQHALIASDVTEGEAGPLVLTESVDSDLSYYYQHFDTSMTFFKGVPDKEDAKDDEATATPEQLTESESALQKGALDALKSVFGREDVNRRLFTSCLWLFRAYVSTRRIDVILESTIALEVLLGDRDAAEGLGLTNLLANRCAFLLGRSADERARLISDFKALYDIRSQIVHRGLHQTDKRVSDASTSARELARRVIRKELRLVA